MPDKFKAYPVDLQIVLRQKFGFDATLADLQDFYLDFIDCQQEDISKAASYGEDHAEKTALMREAVETIVRQHRSVLDQYIPHSGKK